MILYTKINIRHLFVIRTAERHKLEQSLYDNGIETVIHYPFPSHKQETDQEWNDLSYPITEKIHNEVLCLPINPVIKEEEVNYVVKALNEY